jgi:hypothetical protein
VVRNPENQVIQKGVEGGPGRVKLEQGLDLRRKGESAAFMEIIKRLDTEGVPGAEKQTFGLVQEREGPHAGEAIQARLSPLGPGVEDYLRIRGRLKAVSQALEFLPDFQVVVDLSIVRDDKVAEAHGLPARC